jgi:hypothetical protein
MSVKTIGVNEREALDAFAVHCALLKAERTDPKLSSNPQWTMLRQDAYERFSNAFTVLT